MIHSSTHEYDPVYIVRHVIIPALLNDTCTHLCHSHKARLLQNECYKNRICKKNKSRLKSLHYEDYISERVQKIWQLSIQVHEQFTENDFRRIASRYKYIEKGDKLSVYH